MPRAEPPRVPVVATLLVLAAVAAMIALGVWQLHRREWKEALIARYTAAHDQPAVAWPRDTPAVANALYHHSSVACATVAGMSAIAGRNAAATSGWAHIAHCTVAGGGTAQVVLGWSNDPAPRGWAGGIARGIVAPGGAGPPRLIADPPLAGLQANASPDPRDLPNNHLSYAVQWFLFAATALVIYAIALRKRLVNSRP